MAAGSIAVPTIIPLRNPIAGQHKNAIDNETLIELRSESIGVTIYYTVNGSRPEVLDRLGYDGRNTIRYKDAFLLLSGRRTIKAMALSSDGSRQSNTVSKVFDVEDTGNRTNSSRQDDGLRFVSDLKAKHAAKKEVDSFAMVTHKQACADIQRSKMHSTEQMMQDMSMVGVHSNKNYLANRHKGVLSSVAGAATLPMHPLSSKLLPPDNATQVMRLQRETDFLKCVYCFAPRPADPYMRFCNDCGNPIAELPKNRLPPPENGQMGTCVHCKSVVPFNLPTCLICESDIAPQLEPQGAIRLANVKLCVHCGTGNPANLQFCVTCQSSLPNMSINNQLKNNSSAKALGCSKCGRVNHPDARFCDWCGNKPTAPTGSIICTKCAANNQPYAKFCSSCSQMLEAPQRTIVAKSSKASEKWLHVTPDCTPVRKLVASTQTAGLFYPSEREISKLQQKRDSEVTSTVKVTAVSPGRGYWRKQIDHICAHLKAQAQNNTEFRSLISEPRMGKILTTSVHEDNYEISINLSFALRDKEFAERSKSVLSSRSNRRNSLSNSYTSSIYSMRNSISKTSRKVKKKKKLQVESKHNEEDRRLIKELGKKGQGRITEIQQLIDEGADPNITTTDEMPLLHFAVKNLHSEAIPILIQEGATVNKKGPKGNTALHEAMLLGADATEVVDALLSCGANAKKKNDKQETPYDLAISKGQDSLADKLTISLGQSTLDKMLKQSFNKRQNDLLF